VFVWCGGRGRSTLFYCWFLTDILLLFFLFSFPPSLPPSLQHAQDGPENLPRRGLWCGHPFCPGFPAGQGTYIFHSYISCRRCPFLFITPSPSLPPSLPPSLVPLRPPDRHRARLRRRGLPILRRLHLCLDLHYGLPRPRPYSERDGHFDHHSGIHGVRCCCSRRCYGLVPPRSVDRLDPRRGGRKSHRGK